MELADAIDNTDKELEDIHRGLHKHEENDGNKNK